MSRGYHDIGGEPYGEIPRDEPPWAYWEKKIEAIRSLLGDGTRQLVSVDEVRLGYESFGIEKYKAYSFYRRRIEAVTNTLIEKGVFTREDFDQELETVKKERAENDGD